MKKRRVWASLILAIGGVVVVSSVWHLLREPIHADATIHRSIDLLLIVGSGVGILYGGLWHLRTPLPAVRYPRVLGWFLGGGVLLLGLNIITLYLGSMTVELIELLEVAHVAGSVGLLTGLLLGTVEAQSILHAEAAAQADTRARTLQEERRRLEQLDELLRHYILNSVSIIDGYAGELRGSVDRRGDRSLEAITAQTDRMVTLVEHIRSVASEGQARTPRGPVDLTEVLNTAAAEVDPSTAVSIVIADDPVSIEGHDTVEDGLHLLLGALVSITGDDGTIHIASARDNGTVELSFTVTDATLSSAMCESLFEPIGTGTGLQFYLAKELLEPSGTIDLVEATDGILEFEARFRSRQA